MARFRIESMHGVRDAENNDRLLGITGLSENLGRDNGIKKPYWANEEGPLSRGEICSRDLCSLKGSQRI